MKRRVLQVLCVAAVAPMLLAADGGCGGFGGGTPLPDTIVGCHLKFTATGGPDKSKFSAPLDYTFLGSTGTHKNQVKGVGAGGTYYSTSYSYKKPKITIKWTGGGTETETLKDDGTFTYLGSAGGKTYNVTGTYKIISGCDAAP